MQPLEKMRYQAYPTPPYGDSPEMLINDSDKYAFNELLVDEMATYLSFCEGTDFNCNRHFLKELLRRSQCNRRSALLAIAYIRRIYENVGQREESEIKYAKKIYLGCLIISNKFLMDKAPSMEAWCLISGLTASELCSLERWCLHRLDYRLYIRDGELYQMEKTLSALVHVCI